MIARLLAVVVLLATPNAHADEDDLTIEELASKKARKAAKKDKQKQDKKEAVRIGGRVVTRLAVTDIGDNEAADFAIESARLEARKRWHDFTVAAEIELSGNVKLKDAFVRWGRNGLEVQGGHFKEPISAIELTGVFTLPTADRGLLHDILTKRLGIGGRRPGAQVSWEGAGALEPTAALGVFQGISGDGELLDRVALDSQNIAARITVAPAGVEIGVFGELRAVTPLVGVDAELRHFWNAGVDVTWELEQPGGALRLWGEVMVGESWRDYLPVVDPPDISPIDEPFTIFTAARLIAAFRFGGLDKGERYLEPYVHAGLFKPTDQFGNEAILELRVGVNAGFWRIFRGTLEAQVDRTSRNQPNGLGDNGGQVVDRTAVIAQVGMVF